VSATYLKVVVVQVITLFALYWLQRAFV